MNNTLLLILGMMLVTYIPRLIPYKIIAVNKLPRGINRFLLFIPCTALGALIVPDVFSATPKMPSASLVGIGFAFVYAWYKGGIIVPILGSIFVTFIMLLWKMHY